MNNEPRMIGLEGASTVVSSVTDAQMRIRTQSDIDVAVGDMKWAITPKSLFDGGAMYFGPLHKSTQQVQPLVRVVYATNGEVWAYFKDSRNSCIRNFKYVLSPDYKDTDLIPVCNAVEEIVKFYLLTGRWKQRANITYNGYVIDRPPRYLPFSPSMEGISMSGDVGQAPKDTSHAE